MSSDAARLQSAFNFVISYLLKRYCCFLLDVWTKLCTTFRKYDIRSKFKRPQKLRNRAITDCEDISRQLLTPQNSFVEIARLDSPLKNKKPSGVVLRFFSHSMAILFVANSTNLEYDQIEPLEISIMYHRLHCPDSTTASKQGGHTHLHVAAKNSTPRKRQCPMPLAKAWNVATVV